MADGSVEFKDWIPVMSAFVGAFAGGFAAFWVSRINSRIDRNRKHWAQHRNALVRLEYLLNEAMSITSDNRYLAVDAANKLAKPDGRIPMMWFAPKALPRDSSLLIDLLRLEIINEAFSYFDKVRKLNDDMDMAYVAYSEMRGAMLRKDIDGNAYKRSLNEYKFNLERLGKAYHLMDHVTVGLLARVRVTLRMDSHHDKCRFYHMPRLEDVGLDEISSERSEVEQECVQIGARSRGEIARFLGDVPSEGT